MKKLFVSLMLVASFIGCCGGPIDTTPKYNVKVFAGEKTVAEYQCYDFERNTNGITIWTSIGRVRITGTTIIEPYQAKVEAESK